MSGAVAETGSFIDERAIDDALTAAATKDAVRVREILAKARELDGLDMDEVAVLSSISDPELMAELFADGARLQGGHLRRAPRALRPALHQQPVQQRLPLLRLPRDATRTCIAAP